MKIVPVEQIPTPDDMELVPLDQPGKVFRVCQEMQVLCELEQGIGLSAVQVGVPWKLFIVKGDKTSPFGMGYNYFVNCSYSHEPDCEAILSHEGCLSLKDAAGAIRRFQVTRWSPVTVKGLRLDARKTLQFVEFEKTIDAAHQGIVFQHEIDHDQGILISQIGKEIAVKQ